MSQIRATVVALSVAACLCVGCVTLPPPQPIAYLAAKKPKVAITTARQDPIKKSFSRSGFYVLGENFRPAPDIAEYIEKTAQNLKTDVLRNADVELCVPFYFDLFFCGYCMGTDWVKVGK